MWEMKLIIETDDESSVERIKEAVALAGFRVPFENLTDDRQCEVPWMMVTSELSRITRRRVCSRNRPAAADLAGQSWSDLEKVVGLGGFAAANGDARVGELLDDLDPGGGDRIEESGQVSHRARR
jgi:hypothetical protein